MSARSSSPTPEPVPERALDAQWYTDIRALGARDLDGFDAVVQLAAVSNDPMSHRFETVPDDINHLGAIHVAKIATEDALEALAFPAMTVTVSAASST